MISETQFKQQLDVMNYIYILIFVLLFLFHSEQVAPQSKRINFKPFPSIPTGKTIWDVITPKYAVKQSLAQQTPQPNLQVPQASQNLQTQTPSTTLEQNPPTRLLQTSNKDAVRNFIWPWMLTPQGSTLLPSNSENGSGVMSDTKQLKCVLKIFDYSNPSEDLMNSDQSLDVLYPGSFVQGKYVDSGAEMLVKLPISHEYRYPIRVAGNGNFVPLWAASSEAGDVHRTIKEAIWNSQGFYSSDVYVKLVTSSEITSLLMTVNFNAKVTRALDISGGFVGDWKTKKNKFFITMLQGIADFFPDKMVSDGSAINDAIGVFLKDTFTLTQAQSIQSLGYWGNGNIPLYVNQVTYGRMMVISVQQNEKTKSLYMKLATSLSGVGSADMTTTMTQIFQDSSVKVFSVGPFSQVAVADLKAGNWTGFFTEIPSDSSLIQALKPIAFRLQDFRGQLVKVSNRLQYEQILCQTKPSKNIKIQLLSVYKSAAVFIKRSNEQNFVHFASTGQGDSPIWDITTSLTSGDNDELKVSNTVGKPSFWKRYQRRARLRVWLDGVVVYDATSQCKGCHSEANAFRCRLDKYVGVVSCYRN